MSKKKIKKVVHFRQGCIGCGMCAYICPKYFQMNNNDGLADLLNSKKQKNFYKKEIEPGDEEQNHLAANSCPVNVIKIE